MIVVPIGGGSGAAGACIVAKAIRPGITVIGVQSSAAPAAQRSWSERRLVNDRMETFAEGLATRVAFELPQRILWHHLDDFVLVSEDDLRAATVRMIAATSNLVEPAGAAALAGALHLRDRLAGKRVALDLQRRQHQPVAAARPARDRRRPRGRRGRGVTDGAGRDLPVHSFGVARRVGRVARARARLVGGRVARIARKDGGGRVGLATPRRSTSPSVTAGSTAARTGSTTAPGCSGSRRAGRAAAGRSETAGGPRR